MMKTRASERVYPSRSRASFGIGGGGWLAPARVADYSESGIGLEVRGVCHADLGDAIRVMDRGGEAARHARVVRVALESQGGRRVTKLGCRWISQSEHPACGHAPRRRRVLRSTPLPRCA